MILPTTITAILFLPKMDPLVNRPKKSKAKERERERERDAQLRCSQQNLCFKSGGKGASCGLTALRVSSAVFPPFECPMLILN